jgi:hypothetical protein
MPNLRVTGQLAGLGVFGIALWAWMALVAIIINLGLLAGAVWVIVTVLRAMGVM